MWNEPLGPASARARLAATALLFVFGLGLISPADAVRRREKENPITNAPEEEVVKEIANPEPPAYPADSNWIEFKPNGQTRNRYYIDASSLTVGADKVIRFALRMDSPLDSRTISYSGLRCRTKEWKDYAFATPEHTWRRDAGAPWRPIEAKRFNNYQESLFKESFCYGGVMSGGPLGSEKLLLRNLKNPPVQDARVPRRY
jgi:hypothetical protein